MTPAGTPPRLFRPTDRLLKPAHKFAESDPLGEHPYREPSVPDSSAPTRLDPPETYHHLPLPDRSDSDFSGHPCDTFRHTGWQHHRYRVYQSLLRTDAGIDRIWNFTQCGRHSYVVQNPDDPEDYRITGSTCHDRFCLPCANSRASTIAMNVLDHLAAKECRFVTLSLKADDRPLHVLLKEITRCFCKLRTRRLWKKTQVGGVAFIEVKWIRDTGEWNVHLHVLTQGRYMLKRKLSAQWYAITANTYVVDIKFVNDRKHVSRYVSKYASKPLHASVLRDDDALDAAIVAFKGKRLCTTFGSWRGLLLTDHPTESAWDYVDTLSSLIDRGLRGDPEAIRVLNSLGCPDVIVLPEPRPPPTPRKPRLKATSEDQLTLQFAPCNARYLQHES